MRVVELGHQRPARLLLTQPAVPSPLHSSGRSATRSRILWRPPVMSTTAPRRLARTAVPSKRAETTARRSAGRSGATAYRPGVRRTLARPRSPVVTRSRRPRPSRSTADCRGTWRGRASEQVRTTIRTVRVTRARVGAAAGRAPQPARAASSAARTLTAAVARARRPMVMHGGRPCAGCGSRPIVSAVTFAGKALRKGRNRSPRG